MWGLGICVFVHCAAVYFLPLYLPFGCRSSAQEGPQPEDSLQRGVLVECGHVHTPWSGKPYINLRMRNIVQASDNMGLFYSENIIPGGKSTKAKYKGGKRQKINLQRGKVTALSMLHITTDCQLYCVVLLYCCCTVLNSGNPSIHLLFTAASSCLGLQGVLEPMPAVIWWDRWDLHVLLL